MDREKNFVDEIIYSTKNECSGYASVLQYYFKNISVSRYI